MKKNGLKEKFESIVGAENADEYIELIQKMIKFDKVKLRMTLYTNTHHYYDLLQQIYNKAKDTDYSSEQIKELVTVHGKEKCYLFEVMLYSYMQYEFLSSSI